MKFEYLKTGMLIFDNWFNYGVGEVKEILKTRVKVKYLDMSRTYDKPHVKYLDKWTDKNKDTNEKWTIKSSKRNNKIDDDLYWNR